MRISILATAGVSAVPRALETAGRRAKRCAIVTAVAVAFTALSAIVVNTSARGACTPVARFQQLGNLDPAAQPPGSLATNVSADGRIVVGYSAIFNGESTQTRGFRWTEDNGLMPLDIPPGGLDSSAAMACSNDGSVIAGGNGFAIGAQLEIRNAMFWTNAHLAPNPVLVADGYLMNDVTADGSIIIGATRVPGVPFPIIDQMFRMISPQDGGVETLGVLPGGSYSYGEACSADGSIIVGFGDNPDSIRAVMWTAATGLVEVPGMPPGPCQASGISADGTVMTGNLGNEAFRWTAATGPVTLGVLAGADQSFGQDVSADGNVIVGLNFGAGAPADIAFLWKPGDGMRAVQEILIADYGVPLPGWSLLNATGVSDDGRTIVGYGLNPEGNLEAWRVQFGFAEDLNSSGSVDVSDLLIVINEWGSIGKPGSSIPGDATGDAIVNVNDLLAIINAWGPCVPE